LTDVSPSENSPKIQTTQQTEHEEIEPSIPHQTSASVPASSKDVSAVYAAVAPRNERPISPPPRASVPACYQDVSAENTSDVIYTEVAPRQPKASLKTRLLRTLTRRKYTETNLSMNSSSDPRYVTHEKNLVAEVQPEVKPKVLPKKRSTRPLTSRTKPRPAVSSDTPTKTEVDNPEIQTTQQTEHAEIEPFMPPPPCASVPASSKDVSAENTSDVLNIKVAPRQPKASLKTRLLHTLTRRKHTETNLSMNSFALEHVLPKKRSTRPLTSDTKPRPASTGDTPTKTEVDSPKIQTSDSD
jgi:hypothetical protein